MKLEGMQGCPAVAPIDQCDYPAQCSQDHVYGTLGQEVRGALVSNVNIELYNALHYHMIVTVNCARIIHGNQVATNGVVHVIDRVITAVGNTIQDAMEVDDNLSSFSVRT
ncbi:unnamed protein product, partial [Coregonus sp. 'balchen']